MTQPRPVIPGSTLLLTRRVVRRHFLFRPDPEIKQLYLYALGYFANKYGMQVHAVALMSTHKHDVVTDVHGQRPRFVAEFHRIVALATKVLRKWEGAVWDERETSVVELETPQAIVKEVAYTRVNPTACGAVRRPEQWPGVCTSVDDLGQTVIRVKRPTFYFDPKNPQWPDEVAFPITMPRQLPDEYGTDERIRQVLEAEVERQIAQAHREARTMGWTFLGPARVEAASPYKRATSYEPLFSTNPTFAVGPGNRPAFFAAVAKLRAFRAAYRRALEAWCLGERDVVFPFGTWAVVVLHGATACGPGG